MPLLASTYRFLKLSCGLTAGALVGATTAATAPILLTGAACFLALQTWMEARTEDEGQTELKSWLESRMASLGRNLRGILEMLRDGDLQHPGIDPKQVESCLAIAETEYTDDVAFKTLVANTARLESLAIYIDDTISKNHDEVMLWLDRIVQTIHRIDATTQEINRDVKRIVDNLLTRNEALEAENDDLRTKLTEALKRVEDAHKAGDNDAPDPVKDPEQKRSLAYLISQRHKAAKDLIQRDREILVLAYITGAMEQAEAAAQRILEVLPNDRDALNRLGHIQQLRGEHDMAAASYQRVFDLSTDSPNWRVIALGNLGLNLFKQSKYDEAERNLLSALKINIELNRPGGAARNYGNLGLIYLSRDDLDQAEQMLRRALDINENLGREIGTAFVCETLGMIHLRRGKLDQAEQSIQKSLKINTYYNRLEGIAGNLGNLGPIYLTRGDLDDSEQVLLKALDINRSLNRTQGVASNYGNLGALYRQRGNLDQAEKMFREAIISNERLGRRLGLADNYANLGGIAHERGDYIEARRLWEKSIRHYKLLGAKDKIEMVTEWLRYLPKDNNQYE